MSQVMSTSPALPYHTNCLYAPNAAAEETVSLPAKVLLKLTLKLTFLNAGVKEMLTCMPKLDEHIFATAKSYMTVFVFILSIIVKNLQCTFQCYNTFLFFIYVRNNIE